MCNNATDRSIIFPEVAAVAALPTPQQPAQLPIAIRPVVPADADLLGALHEGLSAQSQYQRYHGPKPRLAPRERAYFAGADGTDHLALLALAPDGAPLAVARGVRDRDDRASAEIAAEVVDPWQQQGLGSTLVNRLARQAAAVGIERFTATVLAETRLARTLTRRGWHVRERDGISVTLAIDVWTLLRR